MSLRSFHIIFVTISSLLMLYILYWSVNQYYNLHDSGYMGYTFFSIFSFAFIILYGFKFTRLYNRSFNINSNYNFSEIANLFLLFIFPPMILINYIDSHKIDRKHIVSACTGIVVYLIIVFGYLSYYMERDSLIEYEKQLHINEVNH